MTKCLLLDSSLNWYKLTENEDVEVDAGDIFIGEGSVQDYQGNTLDASSTDWKVGLFGDLEKSPYKRKLISKQILSGHLRIDLN